MKTLLVKTFLVLLAFLFIAGCTGQAQSPQGTQSAQQAVPVTGWNNGNNGTVVSTPNIQTINQLSRSAQTYGLDSGMVGPIVQPFIDQPGEIVMIDGQQVQVFQFPSEGAMKQALALIPRTGTAVAGTPVVMFEPLQIWSGGDMLVLYPGKDEKVINFLNAVFGQPRP